MSDLQKKYLDRDLIVLDEIVGEGTLPSRDWDTIISLYNHNNRPFSIRPIDCSKIIDRIKDGQRPHMVFKEHGYHYPAFIARYNKPKMILEELSTLSDLSDNQWAIVDICQKDPYLLLGRDIERATAYHYNEGTMHMKKVSKGKAIDWKEYMKMVHPEEFEDKSETTNMQVTIKFGPGLLEGI